MANVAQVEQIVRENSVYNDKVEIITPVKNIRWLQNKYLINKLPCYQLVVAFVTMIQ